MKLSKELLDKNRRRTDQLLVQIWEGSAFSLHPRLKNIPEKTTFWLKEANNGESKAYNLYFSRLETDEEVEVRLASKYNEYLTLKAMFE